MTARALVVEDHRGTLDVIGDTLVSLRHQYDVATNQEDARDKLNRTDYEYVLLDLHIPAKRKRSFPSIDHGVNLLSEIRAIKGTRQIPVIVMTGHSAEALNMAAELLANGATALISKPFPPTGKTLSAVIREVLTRTETVLSSARVPARPQPEEARTVPMSLAELARRYMDDQDARADKVKPMLEKLGLRQVTKSKNKWTVCLDNDLDAKTRERLTRPTFP